MPVGLHNLDFDRHVPRKPYPLGWGQGAPYQKKGPFREAPPFKAWSFTNVESLRCDRHRSLHHATLHLWNLQPWVPLRLCGVRFGNHRFQETHIRRF